jgi:hypothetical protein
MIYGMLSLCTYVSLNTSLAPERLDGVYSNSAFRSLFVTDRWSLNIRFPSQVIGALQTGSKTQNADFLENGSNGFD